MAAQWGNSFPEAQDAPTHAVGSVANALGQHGFRFVVEFGGICCFVPAADGKSMGVFLANQSGEPDDAGVPRHKAVVQFPLARVKGVSGIPETSQGLWKPVSQELR